MEVCRHGCSWLSPDGLVPRGRASVLVFLPAAAGALARAALLLGSLGDLAVAAVERVA
jgi:hypothetical protein